MNVSGPPELSRVAAIGGVGETDYDLDFLAARGRLDRPVPGLGELVSQAFGRAVADAGLDAAEVDGLMVSTDAADAAPADIARLLGLRPCYLAAGDTVTPMGMAGQKGVVPTAVEALAAGRCQALALVYCVQSRSRAKQFGGRTYTGDSRHSYYYHHPWGWSSQAAHWALMFTYYQQVYGVSEEDLGRVAQTLRAAAARTPHAIMRTPLGIDEYLAAPYVVRPLRRLDLCLPNDGAVCLILRRVADARDPVVIAGWADTAVTEQKLRQLVEDRLVTIMRAAGDAALEMAGVPLSAVGHFQGYDASTNHLVHQLEGYGFAKPGNGLRDWADGRFELSGELPVNTSGGMLSQAYMHGWNHLAEAARQLRGTAGDRQVPELAVSMLAITTTESAHPLVLVRGGDR